jgi:CelD/BcsL family acetyltransferase involved in cellulose biosynthesis
MQPAGQKIQAPETSQQSLSVRDSKSISQLEQEWDALCQRVDAPPFMRPGWFSAWIDAFGSGEPELLEARRGDELVGVLPLLRNRAGLASPTNWHTPAFCVVAEDDAVEQTLLAEALNRSNGRLDLGFLPDSKDTERIVAGAKRRGYRVISRIVEESPYVDLEGGWEAIEARLPSKRRSDLKRRKRRLSELGTYEFECLDGSERLEELLAEGLEVEAIGWEGRDGTPITAEKHTRLFYEQVARWAAPEGQLRLCFLRLDSKPIAFAYCLVDSGSIYVQKLGFDPEYGKYAPGLLLAREMLAQAAEMGLSTYEWLGADDPYKLIWAEQRHDRGRVQAFPRGANGLGQYLAWRYGRPLVQRGMRAIRR